MWKACRSNCHLKSKCETPPYSRCDSHDCHSDTMSYDWTHNENPYRVWSAHICYTGINMFNTEIEPIISARKGWMPCRAKKTFIVKRSTILSARYAERTMAVPMLQDSRIRNAGVNGRLFPKVYSTVFRQSSAANRAYVSDVWMSIPTSLNNNRSHAVNDCMAPVLRCIIFYDERIASDFYI